MPYAIKIIGIFILIAATICFVQPNVFKNIIEFVEKGKRIYAISVFRIIIGGFILYASRGISIPIISAVIGMIIMLCGLTALLIGPKKLYSTLEWFLVLSSTKIRALLCLMALMGILLIYSA